MGQSVSERAKRQQGFTILELLISIFLFLLITSITFSLFTNSVRVSRTEVTSTHRDEALKSALTLISAEIQQAGSHPDTNTPPPVMLNNVLLGLNQTIRVGNGPGGSGNPLHGINVGDKLIIYDPVTLLVGESDIEVTSIDPATNSFRVKRLLLPHFANSPVISEKKPYRSGILPNSTGNKLKFFGDIFDDGQLYYIEYTYDAPTQRIYRSATLVTGTAIGPTLFDDKSLVRNVLVNPSPSGAPIPVFQYVSDDQGNITSVIVTITTGTGDFLDQRPLTLTTTVTSRNIVAASILTRSRDLSVNQLPATPNWINTLSMQR